MVGKKALAESNKNDTDIPKKKKKPESEGINVLCLLAVMIVAIGKFLYHWGLFKRMNQTLESSEAPDFPLPLSLSFESL